MSITKSILKKTKPMIERFPCVALAYRTWRDSKLQFKTPQQTPMGYKFLGNSIMEQGQFEPEVVDIVKKHLQDADVFINLGANIGYYCCIALHLGKKVIAFEPIEANLQSLYQNIYSNQWDQIEIYPIAISNKIGLTEIFGGGTGASMIDGWAGASNNYHRLVPTSTLDHIIGDKLNGQKCFILVDIEGTEKLMLEGAQSILKLNPKPIWLVEITIFENQPSGTQINPNLLSTFQIFWNNGYESRTADKHHQPVCEDNIIKIIESGSDQLSSHNFLFTEKK